MSSRRLRDTSDTDVPALPLVTGGARMADYRFRYIQHDEIIFEDTLQFADDLDALDHATMVSAEFEVEVWQGDHRVAYVKLDDEAPRSVDAMSN